MQPVLDAPNKLVLYPFAECTGGTICCQQSSRDLPSLSLAFRSSLARHCFVLVARDCASIWRLCARREQNRGKSIGLRSAPMLFGPARLHMNRAWRFFSGGGGGTRGALSSPIQTPLPPPHVITKSATTGGPREQPRKSTKPSERFSWINVNWFVCQLIGSGYQFTDVSTTVRSSSGDTASSKLALSSHHWWKATYLANPAPPRWFHHELDIWLE